jgi:hypothetical protein
MVAPCLSRSPRHVAGSRLTATVGLIGEVGGPSPEEDDPVRYYAGLDELRLREISRGYRDSYLRAEEGWPDSVPARQHEHFTVKRLEFQLGHAIEPETSTNFTLGSQPTATRSPAPSPCPTRWTSDLGDLARELASRRRA